MSAQLTEAEKLRGWYADQSHNHGVVDIKFCLTNSEEATVESVCREVNAAVMASGLGRSTWARKSLLYVAEKNIIVT